MDGFQRYNGSRVTKKVFKTPCFERKNCFSLVLQKRKIKKE